MSATQPLCPIRPSEEPVDSGDAEDQGYASVEGGPVVAEEAPSARDVEQFEISAEDGAVYEIPRPHSEPRPPSARERAQHCLTHFPYKSWCKHCVAGD